MPTSDNPDLSKGQVFAEKPHVKIPVNCNEAFSETIINKTVVKAEYLLIRCHLATQLSSGLIKQIILKKREKKT